MHHSYWSHPHGCVSWNPDTWTHSRMYCHVTPSRVCELKSKAMSKNPLCSPSHPHGCVSWNEKCIEPLREFHSHTLTGVWVEITWLCIIFLYFGMSHPHGCVSWNVVFWCLWTCRKVTPSRVCELKSQGRQKLAYARASHTLTGVWVEMWHWCPPIGWRCHTLTGVWVEMVIIPIADAISAGHTLTGVWVEIPTPPLIEAGAGSHPHGCVSWNTITDIYTLMTGRSHPHGCVSWNLGVRWTYLFEGVTPSRVCELKCVIYCNTQNYFWSHPHGCVSWNQEQGGTLKDIESHTLTGVWVEIRILKRYIHLVMSHPHGCVSWNAKTFIIRQRIIVTPSRVCELKYQPHYSASLYRWSHPHGCVSWNVWEAIQNTSSVVTPSRVCELKFSASESPSTNYTGHTLTGVWVEIAKYLGIINIDTVTPSRVCELKFHPDNSVNAY